MNPTQPAHDFSFITNAPAPGKSRLTASSPLQRVAVIAVLVVGLLVAGLVFANLMGNGQRHRNSLLIDMAAYQAELARVYDLGMTDGQTTAVRGRAHTAALTLQSDNLQLLSYLAQHHLKLTPAVKAKYNFSAIDRQLQLAKTNNTYDTEFQQLLDGKLGDYQKQLTNTYDAQTGKIIRTRLSGFYAHGRLLYFSKPATN